MWTRSSWENFPASQQPYYSDLSQVSAEITRIESDSGVVEHWEIVGLIDKLAAIHSSETGFLLHAGDCAELFESCTASRIQRDAAFLSEMGQLVNASVVLGRICGQFGKPRSKDIDEFGSLVFRGDIINGTSHTQRLPDPARMGIAHSLSLQMYQSLHPKIFISHECLLLPYEAALVRYTPGGSAYNSSAHFLWIGDRTRELDGAHVEFCRGLANPIGIKVGPTSNAKEILNIVSRVNPQNIPGKVTLITRFGKLETHRLAAFIQAMRGQNIVWQCDPMHGNTVQEGKFKTRYISDITQEIRDTVIAHRMVGSRLHGVHLETTGESGITECIGVDVGIEDLSRKYTSACDPRLNPTQTRHVLGFLANLLNEPEFKRHASTPSTEDFSSQASDSDNCA